MTTKAAQMRATNNFIRNHTKRYTIQCHNEYDADIIAHLATKDNYTSYIKDLIRKDIEKTS